MFKAKFCILIIAAHQNQLKAQLTDIISRKQSEIEEKRGNQCHKRHEAISIFHEFCATFFSF